MMFLEWKRGCGVGSGNLIKVGSTSYRLALDDRALNLSYIGTLNTSVLQLRLLFIAITKLFVFLFSIFKMASNHSVHSYSYPTTLFGPTAPGRFDFTPFFEDTLLSIVPSAILLLLLPPRLFILHKQSRKVSRSSLHSQKLVCSLISAWE